ncbi:MAG TPA: archaellin/type IV pilin N-terminal domain-containing protein [Thermoplasmata archaeon]|nr:archaellin/type IV pilin N-terminal domain-containing protein [Thermoplasmata archaeon]
MRRIQGTGGRRRRRRGVSPILATILLVAITVVLAAVLYVVVSGLSHGVNTVPLGTKLYAGPSSAVMLGTKATNTGKYCQTSHYCYSIPIQEGGGLTISDIGLTVMDGTGTVHTVSANYAYLSLVDASGSLVAQSQLKDKAAFSVTSWTTLSKGVTSSTPLTSDLSIWVQFGNKNVSPAGMGDSLVISGLGAYSGTISIPLP